MHIMSALAFVIFHSDLFSFFLFFGFCGIVTGFFKLDCRNMAKEIWRNIFRNASNAVVSRQPTKAAKAQVGLSGRIHTREL